MQISVKHDLKQMTKYLNKVEKKQIPFATTVALNDVAFGARTHLQRKAQQDLDNPTPWTLNGFRVVKANKRTLKALVYIAGSRGLPGQNQDRNKYMALQIQGGTRVPGQNTKGRAIVIPTKHVPRNQYGNPKGRGVAKRIAQSKRGFSGKIDETAGIWQNQGRGKNATTRLMFRYKDSVSYRPRFHFHRYGRAFVRQRFGEALSRAMAQALATGRTR